MALIHESVPKANIADKIQMARVDKSIQRFLSRLFVVNCFTNIMPIRNMLIMAKTLAVIANTKVNRGIFFRTIAYKIKRTTAPVVRRIARTPLNAVRRL